MSPGSSAAALRAIYFRRPPSAFCGLASPKPSRLTGGGVWSEDRRGACTSGKDRADCAVSSGGAQNTVSRRLAGIRPAAQRPISSATRLPRRMVEAPSTRRPRGYYSSGANVSCDASRCAAKQTPKPGGCNYLTSECGRERVVHRRVCTLCEGAATSTSLSIHFSLFFFCDNGGILITGP